jgi:alpha-glucosidase (family GH31 glycosyl hydrolase)
MDQYFDFTWDPQRFPQSEFAAFVDQLHRQNQHFVVIVDPGISNTSGYSAYDSGRAQNVFIKRADGSEFRALQSCDPVVHFLFFQCST